MTDHTDREKQAHISLSCGNVEGKPVLAIHDKNGRKHASFTFRDTDDMRDFGEQIIDFAGRLEEATRHV